MWPFKRRERVETRSSGSGYTTQIMQARAAYIAGADGVAELTATVQAAVTLWENGLSVADVGGTDLLTKRTLALAARALALRGECVFVIEDGGLLPCSDWDLTTQFSKPTAYRVSVPDTGGGKTRTVLAGEVLHFRTGCDVSMPYIGTPPLRRSGLTASLLQHVETALAEIYRDAPLGTSVVPYPERADIDMDQIACGFRGHRGKIQVRESVVVAAAGGPAPMLDWLPRDLTPDLNKAAPAVMLGAARDAINMAFGVLPGMTATAATGPLIREGQRHIAQWQLQPLAEMMAEEATDKLGSPVTLDVMVLSRFSSGFFRAMFAMKERTNGKELDRRVSA